jgi:hypothetical protein
VATTDASSGDATAPPADGDRANGGGGGGVSRTALVLAVIGAFIIGGLGGAAIGWKVEQNRVKDDVANIRPIGTVTAVNGNNVTVKLRTASGTRTFVMTKDTAVDKAGSAASDDVVQGATVLVRSRESGGKLQATQIIVLPDGSTSK